ncbi:amidohydrolase family protein [Pseudoalteromonas rubra]|uniref:Amidohydrolase n=1 Tax=Pseudoalteromonas rubra TaxID=43658 RepID=A0A5S3X3V1_9GAMM|nr:amidohydrolase family protein [Pseudoalteromonas rubra]TMP38471.1 amidohydrolase [Pseudoalteromonas rubra]
MYKVFDSDRHVVEPVELWDNYIDEEQVGEYRVSLKEDTLEEAQLRAKKYGNLRSAIQLIPTLYVGQHPIFNHWSEELQIESTHQQDSSQLERLSAMSGKGQLASMDLHGIEKAAIFPTFASYVINHAEISAKSSLAYAEGYNEWLNEYVSADKTRLLPVGAVSRHDPETLAQQVKAIASYGWTTISIRPEVINGHSLGSQAYEPFWQACEEYNIGICLHGGSNLHGSTAGSERFTSRFGLHACSHPIELQMAFVSLLENGVFEKYPKLKFALLEGGGSWVPYWLWRLDNICYPEYPNLVKDNIKKLPSEYFKSHCWVSIEDGEPCIRELIDYIGSDRLLFGSDYPHPDHLDSESSDDKEEFSFLTETEKKEIYELNPSKFFNF